MLATSHLSRILWMKKSATLIQCVWRQSHDIKCFLVRQRNVRAQNASIALPHFLRQAQSTSEFVALAFTNPEYVETATGNFMLYRASEAPSSSHYESILFGEESSFKS
jgi:hypothetical protein